MNRFAIGFLGIILLWACNKNDDPEPAPQPSEYERTVLVYMSGENNLVEYGYMRNDLKEIDEGSYQLTKNQHLIVFVDSIGTSNPPYIMEVVDGKRNLLYQYDSDFPACDPDKFREVVKWTIDHSPSKEYALVLWGHASGWAVETDTIASTRAYGYDDGYDLSGKKQSMNITQMAKALDGLPKLKYIFADCCCFMCAESAYELRNTADYLIGSPAEIPGDGAPYKEILPKLFSNSDTFYQDICDTYYDYYYDAYKTSYYSNLNLQGYSVPLSVVDLSKMESLAKATNLVLSTFATAITKPAVLNLANQPFYYGDGYPAMYDMQSVIRQNAPSEAYSQWLAVFNQIVPYLKTSRKWQTIYNTILYRFSTFPTDETQYGCLSMFFPQSNYDYSTYKYNSRIKNYQWYYAVNWNNYGW